MKNRASQIYKFSQRMVADAMADPPSEGQATKEYTDAIEEGFKLAVYRSGKGSFRHRGTFEGQPFCITLGPAHVFKC